MGIRKFVAAVSAIICIGLALLNIMQWPFSKDETFSLFFSNGISNLQVQDQFKDSFVSRADLFLFLESHDPDPLKTYELIAQFEPYHPPLYYMLAALVANWKSHQRQALRLISFIFFVCSGFIFAGILRHATQLEWTPLVTGSLFFTGPFFWIFAQEAREYSLFMFLLLGSILMDLKKSRVGTLIFSVLAYYTSIWALIIYPIIIFSRALSERHVFLKNRFLFIDFLLSLLLFAPWLFHIVASWLTFRSDLSWMLGSVDPVGYLDAIQRMFAARTFDTNLRYSSIDFIARLTKSFAPVVIALHVLSVFKKQSSLVGYVGSLLVVVGLLLTLGLDLLFGSVSVLSGRYWCLFVLGLSICYCTFIIDGKPIRFWTIYLFAIFAGLVSISIQVMSPTWWNKGNIGNPVEQARYLENQEEPILAGESPVVLTSVAYHGNANLKVLVDTKNIATLVKSNVNLYFVGDASNIPKDQLNQLKLIPVSDKLMKLERIQ